MISDPIADMLPRLRNGLMVRHASVLVPASRTKLALAKILKVELRPLGSSEVQAKSDEELRRNISEGTGKMKPVTGLSEVDLANLVAFVRTLK